MLVNPYIIPKSYREIMLYTVMVYHIHVYWAILEQIQIKPPLNFICFRWVGLVSQNWFEGNFVGTPKNVIIIFKPWFQP